MAGICCACCAFAVRVAGGCVMPGRYVGVLVVIHYGDRLSTRIYQCITNNHAVLHLWWMENLINNHQKVSQHYEHDNLQNFLLLLMSLLTALIVEQSYFHCNLLYLSKNKVLDQTWKAFNSKFGPHQKDREKSYQVRQVLALFNKLVALISG